MGKVYVESADFQWFNDIVHSMEGALFTVGPAKCNLTLSGEKPDIIALYNALYNKGIFNIDDFSISAAIPAPRKDIDCCSYCGKRYDDTETNCRACGGPRTR